jgi:hypothetical protein
MYMTGFKDRIDNIPVRPGTSVLVELFSQVRERKPIQPLQEITPDLSCRQSSQKNSKI